MTKTIVAPPKRYFRCFISAPFGLDLGSLPTLLGERHIAWNWAAEGPSGSRFVSRIQKCDFVVAVMNGAQSDQNVLYEIGLAHGLGKPVFFIAASKKVKRFARSLFPFVDVKLVEREALAFHLDAFLSTPHKSIFESDNTNSTSKPGVPPSSEPPENAQVKHSLMAKKVYEAVVSAGGSAIVEPKDADVGHRPDLLIWLASEDPEIFDPAVIEIKNHLSGIDIRKAEQQLWHFMQNSGVRYGLLLTSDNPPEKRRPTTPYIFWLSVDHFVALAKDRRLGQYIRNLRNQAVHGAA